MFGSACRLDDDQKDKDVGGLGWRGTAVRTMRHSMVELNLVLPTSDRPRPVRSTLIQPMGRFWKNDSPEYFGIAASAVVPAATGRHCAIGNFRCPRYPAL